MLQSTLTEKGVKDVPDIFEFKSSISRTIRRSRTEMIQFISCNIVGNRFMQCAHIKYNSRAILLKTSIAAEKNLNILHLLVIYTSNYLLTVIWQKSFWTFWTEKDQKNFSFQTLEKIISNLTVAKNPSRSLQFPLPSQVKQL